MKQICASSSCGDNKYFICQNDWDCFEDYKNCAHKNSKNNKMFEFVFKEIKELNDVADKLDDQVVEFINLSDLTKREDCEKADWGNCVVYNIRKYADELRDL